MKKKFFESLYNLVCNRVPDEFDSFCREHYRFVVGSAFLFMTVVMAAVPWAFFVGQYWERTGQPERIVAPASPSLVAQNPLLMSGQGGADHDVLGGSWSEDNHEVNCYHNVVRLERDAKDAIIDYNEQITLGSSTIAFTFIPTGKNAYNIGYGRRTFYEFMFGDGDKSKVSLKYDINHDGSMEFIELNGSLDYSKAAQGVFVPDLDNSSEIQVRISENIVSDSRIQLTLIINEKYTLTSEVLPMINAPQYNRVYISMVDYSKDGDNQTAAEFPGLSVCPLS